MQKILFIQAERCFYKTLMSQLTLIVSGITIDVVSTLQEAKEAARHEDYLMVLVDVNFTETSKEELKSFLEDIRLPLFLIMEEEEKKFLENLKRSTIVDVVYKESPEVINYIVQSIHRIYRNRTTKVLIVDDSDSDRAYMRMMAENQLYDVCEASDGLEALEMIGSDQSINIIVMDVHMPHLGGIDFLKYIRERKLQNELAILGVSSDEESLIRFMKLGGNDFVCKPFSRGEFTTRLNKLAEVYEYIKELDELSSKDYLTQLRSRKYFYEVGTPYVYDAYKRGESCAVAMIDIDNFKYINDTYGHPVGDVILKRLASILHGSLKGADIVARYGGEEFCILLRNTDDASAKIVFENIREKVQEEVVSIVHIPQAIRVKFTISIGMSTHVRHSLEKMVAQADYWLYQAKKTGKNRICFQEEYETKLPELV